ncbi:MAG: hypothetical protein AAF805_10790 [Planctomycetota bacterium]
MSDANESAGRPAFRFSLRSLLVFVTAASLLFAVAPWFIELSFQTKMIALGALQFAAEVCFLPWSWQGVQRRRRYPPGDDGDPASSSPEKPVESSRFD